jgi:uncharacterized DUF497 family protein
LEWDAEKAESNLRKHGVPFEAAAAVFMDPERADFDASRIDEGEDRRKVVGRVDGLLFTVVYTLRSDAVRIISARRANSKEARAYGDRQVYARPE